MTVWLELLNIAAHNMTMTEHEHSVEMPPAAELDIITLLKAIDVHPRELQYVMSRSEEPHAPALLVFVMPGTVAYLAPKYGMLHVRRNGRSFEPIHIGNGICVILPVDDTHFITLRPDYSAYDLYMVVDTAARVREIDVFDRAVHFENYENLQETIDRAIATYRHIDNVFTARVHVDRKILIMQLFGYFEGLLYVTRPDTESFGGNWGDDDE